MSNEDVLEKLQEKNPMSVMNMRTYFQKLNSIDKKTYDYYEPHFNEWLRLRKPDLSEMTINAILYQLGEFITYKKEFPEKVESELKEGAKQEFLEKYKRSSVFLRLIKDIDSISVKEPIERLDKLLSNFVKAGSDIFDYTMDSISTDKFLNGSGNGDCNTLAFTFKLIAETYLDIPVEHHHSGEKGFKDRFRTPSQQTIDGKTGNVNGGEFWVFDNHYWIEYAGQTYDVLFGVKGDIDTSSWVSKTGDEDEAEVFGEKKVKPTGNKDIATRYTTV
jgi:hypothetical protein